MTTVAIESEAVSRLIDKHGARPEMLVQILNDVVAHFRYVPDDSVRQLAQALNLSRAEVHGVVSYYHDFRTEPPGKHIVKVCQAEACQAAGGRGLTAHAERLLGVEMHGRSDEVSLEPVYCLGNCACAPAVMINGKTHGRVSAKRFDELAADMRSAD